MESEEPNSQVDLSDDTLKVSIADALNEQDVVKFTVHTKSTVDRFQRKDFQVIRQHEEFKWLYDRFIENDANAGLIIPPCPPKPDFSQSNGKLAKIQGGDGTQLPQDEQERLKQEIQSEYLAAFQKTVAMHEVFLMRLASHPVLREDDNFKVFLEYDKDLQTRGRSKKEQVVGFFASALKAVDSSFAKHQDQIPFFDDQKTFILHYIESITDAKNKSSNKVKSRLELISNQEKAATYLVHLSNTQNMFPTMAEMIRKSGECQGASVLIEKKLAAREDLKMTDMLRYYMADSNAAKDLMCRRIKCFNDLESKKKALESARKKQQKVVEAQEAVTGAELLFGNITTSAKKELEIFSKRRLAFFRKGLIQYTQAQIKQAKESYTLWKDTLTAVKNLQDKMPAFTSRAGRA